MVSALHVLATLVATPYVILALYFLFIGRLAAANGLFAFFGALLETALWLVPWGALLLATLVLAVAALGVFASTRFAGSLCLFVLSSSALAVLLLARSEWPAYGELGFLLPCVAVLAFSLWSAQRVR